MYAKGTSKEEDGMARQDMKDNNNDNAIDVM